MILLTMMGPQGPQLAAKVPSGILVLADAAQVLHLQDQGPIPESLGAALAEPGGLDRVAQYVAGVLRQAEALKGLTRPEEEVRIGLPFMPRNIICVGLNYADHARESGVDLPERPILFAKLLNSVIGPGESIVLPPESAEVDYEAELAVVIGRHCRRVRPEEALDYVAGYTCINDVSARDFQLSDRQWVRGKSQDTFAPIGPYLVTRDEVPDPQDLDIRCLVNGDPLQDSNTRQMIFSVKDLISFISQGMTLEPGDVIATGTPHGVGFAREPKVYLQDGDEVVVEIERVGRLVNPVRRDA
ncbi:MAG: fumarylacetoacetate hydrolase family protein [Firmicutes bacterium]|nr:fumarylacetoacetate hydrolase family protein [Bacillota bacterium]